MVAAVPAPKISFNSPFSAASTISCNFNTTYFYRNIVFFCKSEDTSSCYSVKYTVTGRGSQKGVTNPKENIHCSGLFKVFMGIGICPYNLLITFFFGEIGRVKLCSIVPCSFGKAHTTIAARLNCSAKITLTSPL